MPLNLQTADERAKLIKSATVIHCHYPDEPPGEATERRAREIGWHSMEDTPLPYHVCADGTLCHELSDLRDCDHKCGLMHHYCLHCGVAYGPHPPPHFWDLYVDMVRKVYEHDYQDVMEHGTFTEDEANALVGKKFKTAQRFREIRKGRTGTVTKVSKWYGWHVEIEWVQDKSDVKYRVHSRSIFTKHEMTDYLIPTNI